jgi:hypothetical protein
MLEKAGEQRKGETEIFSSIPLFPDSNILNISKPGVHR